MKLNITRSDTINCKSQDGWCGCNVVTSWAIDRWIIRWLMTVSLDNVSYIVHISKSFVFNTMQLDWNAYLIMHSRLHRNPSVHVANMWSSQWPNVWMVNIPRWFQNIATIGFLEFYSDVKIQFRIFSETRKGGKAVIKLNLVTLGLDANMIKCTICLHNIIAIHSENSSKKTISSSLGIY